MLVVETIARVRRAHFVQGKTIKAISWELGIARNTIRRILRSGETSFAYQRDVQPRPKLGQWTEELDRRLIANDRLSRRERLGLIRVFEQAHSAPAEDEARLLQGHEPARRLSEPNVRLSRLCVPAEGGDMARQSTRGRVPACSQSEGAESNQANDPAMVLASTERPDPG